MSATSTRAEPKRFYTTDGFILALQVFVGLSALAIWEVAGTGDLGKWVSQPSMVASRLLQWLGGDLFYQFGITVGGIILGMTIGMPLGVLAGLLLGRAPVAAVVLRPLIMAAYSVPFVALAPLLIFLLGLGLAPKVFLVAVVVFFLLFFNTFAGAQAVDQDLVLTLKLMGASPREVFQKLVLPGCMVWILSGFKIALPFALMAGVVGEMLAGTQGLGSVLTASAARFDMATYFAALFLVMVLGLIVGEIATRIENRMLRWRDVNR